MGNLPARSGGIINAGWIAVTFGAFNIHRLVFAERLYGTPVRNALSSRARATAVSARCEQNPLRRVAEKIEKSIFVLLEQAQAIQFVFQFNCFGPILFGFIE